jgi:hypothetical protein
MFVYLDTDTRGGAVMLNFRIPNLGIRWDEELESVFMEWTGFVQGEVFKQAVNQGLELLIAQKGCKWLADLSQMAVIAQEDQRWLDEEWFPRAAQAGVKYIAMIRPAKVLSQMSVRRVTGKTGDLEMETAYFDSLEKAKEWIKSKK